MEEAADVSHYNVQPVIDIFATAEGHDLGSVASDIAKVTHQATEQLPRRKSYSDARSGVHHAIVVYRAARPAWRFR